MKRNLPARPDIQQLKHQAKDLLKSYKAGEPDAVERIRQSHPGREQGRAREQAAVGNLRLSDAQLVVAREYGFESWPKLKTAVENMLLDQGDPAMLLHRAFRDDNASLVRKLLARHPEFKARINAPVPEVFDSPPITLVKSREMLDVLLEAGADINAKSRWWAGGFGLLHSASPELARYAVQRGAVVDVHAAARLGDLKKLRQLIATRPEIVHARGGDGQTPLHFAANVEIASFLLDHRADIDARDVDHESTPAQYMVKSRQDVARYLVGRGCKTDILMAAALGDLPLVKQHVAADPECVRIRVSEEYYPMVGGKTGGTIYQWELGWHVSAHQVAKRFGHREVFEWLMEHSPVEVQLVNAAWLGHTRLVRDLLHARPNLIEALSAGERKQLAHAARNNDTEAAALMIEAGWPLDVRSQHNATPLHWAAWHGNAKLVKLLLTKNSPLEDAQNDFAGAPMRWAVHGSEHGWHCKTGDYAATVAALLAAGATPPQRAEGTDAVKAVLRSAGVRS
ncbi:MAG TPA: ankyrin repeat domain-containing protein [Candidatus Binatia bacterium]|nr:ankyrin repeat domain-containing protein [Candidatus Binatia bacterium]